MNKKLTPEEANRLEDVLVLGTEWQKDFANNILDRGQISTKQKEILEKIDLSEKFSIRPRSSNSRGYGMDHDDILFHTGCKSQDEEDEI